MSTLVAIGWPGCLVAACLAVGIVSFIAAVRTTSVINVAIIYATVPFLTAMLAWLWLQEKLSAVPTTGPGSSSGTASGYLPLSGMSCFRPRT
jgi:hypothetical protein